MTWFKNTLSVVKQWIKERGLKNVGWIIAFIATFLFFKSESIFYAFGFVALGIFIEKNRKALVEIYKNIKEK